MLSGAVVGGLFGVGLWQLMAAAPMLDWREFQLSTAKLLSIEPEMLSWLVIGGCGGGVTLGLNRGVAAVALGALAGVTTAFVLFKERQSRRRKQRAIEQSLVTPSFLDMLAISMATGLGLRASLTMVIPKSPEILQELWRPVTDTPEKSLVDQLQEVSQVSEHSPTQRIANALIVSSERGTPIVDVLHNLAQEIRAESRRQLLEIAAKKDVQMMLPVVFGILPSITAIALFPAVGSLTSLA